MPEKMTENEVKIKSLKGFLGKDQAFHVKALIRMMFFVVLCALLLVGNFVWENFTDKAEISTLQEVNYSGSRMNIPGYAYINGNTEEVSDVVSVVTTPYVFSMRPGRIFGNFSNSITKVNIQASDKLVVIPDFSMFDLSYDETSSMVTLMNFSGNTYLGFLSASNPQSKYLDEYSDVFENVLLVPAGVKVKISLGKIDERLRAILYAKLAKEFSYGRISDSDKNDGFIKNNLDEALKYSGTLKDYQRKRFKSLAQDSGNFSSTLYNFLSKNLTVFEKKRNEQYLKNLKGSLYQSLTALNNDEADAALSEFSLAKDSLPQENFDKGYYKDFLSGILADLVVFNSSDPEFKVLDYLTGSSKDQFDKMFLVDLKVGAKGHDIYSDENVGPAYEQIYKGVESIFGAMDDAKVYKKFLSYYNQFFDNLLLNFPELLKLPYFNMKGKIENELFKLYYGGQSKEELKQSFVSEKISLLNTLENFFFDEEIGLGDAKDVMTYLIQSIDDYMPAKTSKNAVMQLFENELKDIGNFWGYINSAEYSKSSLYGENHKQRFAVYLEEKNQVTSILDVQRDILGGNVIVAETPEDIKHEIEKTFSEAGASSVKVGEVSDVHERFVKVSAVISSYEFNADYDRDYGYVKNVYAYGEKISESNVKIDALPQLLSKALSGIVKIADTNVNKPVPRNADASVTSETNAQKIAKTIIAKKMVEAGLSVTLEDVDVLDSTIALYRINNVPVEGINGLSVSFDYLANDGKVKNVYVLKGKEGKSLSGEFPLVELKGIVSDQYL